MTEQSAKKGLAEVVQSFKKSGASETAIHPNNGEIPGQEKTFVQKSEQKVTAEDFFKAISTGNKRTASDILAHLMDSTGNIHMKANIKNPETYALVHMIANKLDTWGFTSVAQIDRDMVNLNEQLGVSLNGERALKILEAEVSVLIQEHEIEKSRARMALGK